MLVVDKPAGRRRPSRRPGTRAARSSTGSSACAAGGEDAERPGIVHRLDRDTSGLLVVARSEEAYARLQELVRERALERRLHRARPRAAALADAAGSRLRSAATGASRPRTRSTRRRRARRSRTSRSSGCSSGTRCSTCASRPGGRTRSASTSPRSTCRSSATRPTASPDERLDRQFLHACAPRVPASDERRAGRGRVAAAGRDLSGSRLARFALVEPLVGEAEERVRVGGLVREVRDAAR